MKHRLIQLTMLAGFSLTGAAFAQEPPAALLTVPQHVEFDVTRPCTVLSVINASSQRVTLSGQLLFGLGAVTVTLTPASSGQCPKASPSASVPFIMAAGAHALIAVQPDPDALQTLQGQVASLPGTLVLEGAGTTSRATVSLPAVSRRPADLALQFRQLVLWTGLLALLIAFGAWWFSKTPGGVGRVPLKKPMLPAYWSQDKSWGTQVAILTGLASTVGGVVELEGPVKLLVGFTGVVFAVLSLVAPMLYRSTQRIVGGQLMGPVWGYLLSSVLTLWAAFGGLVSINAFLKALAAQLAPLGLGWLGNGLNVVTLALALIVCLFALRRVQENIEQAAVYRGSLM